MKLLLDKELIEKFANPEEGYTYFYLILHADENYNVVISQDKLGKAIGRNRDTTRNILKKLEEKYLIVQHSSKNKNLIHLPDLKLHTVPDDYGKPAPTEEEIREKEKEIKERLEKQRKEEHERNSAKFDKWLKATHPHVANMENTLSYNGMLHLKESFGYERAMMVLDRMENYKPLLKNNRDAFMTAFHWLNKEDYDRKK